MQSVQRIREVGLRVTRQRLALVTFLKTAHRPLSAQEIARSLKSKKIDQVTVYRMLDSFVERHIAREVTLRGQPRRFELAGDDHHHIVCTKCDKVEDFVGCDSEKMEKRALRQSRAFSNITGHSFDLYGLCNNCT